MHIKWFKSQVSTQPAIAASQFLAQDFFKLVAYAVASGIAFSALAIGAALAVSQDGDAQTAAPHWVAQDHMFVVVDEVEGLEGLEGLEGPSGSSEGLLNMASLEQSDDFSAPGSLFVGDGCGAEEVGAIEREWYVTIDGNLAIVQVMQTFVVPEEPMPEFGSPSETEPVLPWFSAMLPKGAQLLNLVVDTSKKRLLATSQSMDQLNNFDDEAHQQMARAAQAKGELPMFITGSWGDEFVSTGEVLGLRAGETVVVTYRYRVLIDDNDGRSRLSLPLQGIREGGGGDGHGHGDDDSFSTMSSTDENLPTGAVWVDWKNPRTAPRVFDVFPRDAIVEQSRGGIVGLSWATNRIAPGEKFTLGWR
jgi:hypothetical protein